MSENEEIKDQEFEQLKKSNFKQQTMSAWRPTPTVASVAITFLVFGVIFVAIGVVLLIFSNKTVEIKIRYSDNPKCLKENPCTLEIVIPEDMKKPIFIYYQIDGFSQNHRLYLSSKSDDQLKGKSITLEQMKKNKDCYPAITNKEMGKGDQNEDIAVPCGLMARSYFNDNFTDWKIDTESFSPTEKGIAYTKEIEKFKNPDLTKQWVDITDEHFIVWMRPSPFPDVRKLWARIEDRDFKKGQRLSVTIKNNFGGHSKYLILANGNIFGGENLFLCISYFCLGGVCLITAIVFIIAFSSHMNKMKKI